MASEQQVKTYLAYWFQLGKHLCWDNGKEQLLPQPVIQGNRYSQEFEACWQKIMANEGKNCYLEGTNQTIDHLLSSSWDIESCVRCGMPVPMVDLGVQSLQCPCNDLDNWPNQELPQPRSPVNSIARLQSIQSRLNQVKNKE
ncbi:MAG: hypothetical protein ACFCU5_15760 [Pleurocapsa sp.]